MPLDPAPERTPVLQVPRMEPAPVDPAPVEPPVVPDVIEPVRVLAETGDSWALMFLLVAVCLLGVGGVFVAAVGFARSAPRPRYRRRGSQPFPNLLGK